MLYVLPIGAVVLFVLAFIIATPIRRATVSGTGDASNFPGRMLVASLFIVLTVICIFLAYMPTILGLVGGTTIALSALILSYFLFVLKFKIVSERKLRFYVAIFIGVSTASTGGAFFVSGTIQQTLQPLPPLPPSAAFLPTVFYIVGATLLGLSGALLFYLVVSSKLRAIPRTLVSLGILMTAFTGGALIVTGTVLQPLRLPQSLGLPEDYSQTVFFLVGAILLGLSVAILFYVFASRNLQKKSIASICVVMFIVACAGAIIIVNGVVLQVRPVRGKPADEMERMQALLKQRQDEARRKFEKQSAKVAEMHVLAKQRQAGLNQALIDAYIRVVKSAEDRQVFRDGFANGKDDSVPLMIDLLQFMKEHSIVNEALTSDLVDVMSKTTKLNFTRLADNTYDVDAIIAAVKQWQQQQPTELPK